MRTPRPALPCLFVGILALSLACSGGDSYKPDPDPDEDGWDTGDCAENDASIYPGADERCNGRDDDCDGYVDEDAEDATRSWSDYDGDGYGDPLAGTRSCEVPWTHVSNDDDCDDDDPLSYPGAAELCDAGDNDCDRVVDEEVEDGPLWYADNDGDGYGDASSSARACEAPSGYVSTPSDCDDDDATANPGSLELCGDAVDNDCEEFTPDDCGYQLLDLDDADATLLARSAGERVGASLAAGGDIDDDGLDDVILGGPGSGTSADGAYVVLGSFSGTASLSSAHAHLEGSQQGVEAGYAVAGAGDVNDDGYDDLLMGVPAELSSGVATGAAYLYYGPEVDGCEPYCEGAVLFGESSGDRAGAALAAGDLQGDGLNDLLVGAPGRSAGEVAYLVFGAPSGTVQLSDADLTLLGESDSASAGAGLDMGDLNDDGYDDLLLLDPERGDGSVYALLSGVSGELELASAELRVEGAEGVRLSSLSAQGDLNDDGVSDLIVGASLDSEEASEEAAFIYFGPVTGSLGLEDADAWINGEFVYANAGLVVAAGGDVNRDGADDLLLAAPEATALAAPDFDFEVDFPGSVYLVHGPITGGEVRLGQAAWRMYSTSARDLRRASISFAGDIDQDRHEDLLIGAWRNDDVGTEGGKVWMVRGGGL